MVYHIIGLAGAGRRGNQQASAADPPADPLEALQPLERFAATSEVAGSPSPSLESNRPILVEENDQERVGWEAKAQPPAPQVTL